MNLDDLRKPKFNIGGMSIAIFDVGGTIALGYLLADYMKWDKKKTIPSMFVLGYFVHNLTGTDTPLTRKLNDNLGVDVPINNSSDPVGVDEVRYSTL